MGCTNNHRMAKLKRRSNQSGAEPRTPNSSRVVGEIFDMFPGLECRHLTEKLSEASILSGAWGRDKHRRLVLAAS